MSHDDPFASHLRQLAEQAPRVTVDRAGVLRSGRRRRAARSGAIGTATVLGVAGLYSGVAALPGLGGTDPGPATTSSPATTEPAPSPTTAPPTPPTVEEGPQTTTSAAVVDEEAGTITLPLDAWMWDQAEWATSLTAVDLFVDRCLADRGLVDEYVFGGPYPVENVTRSYGVWREEVLLESGYASVHDVLDENWAGESLAADHPRAAEQVECHTAALEAGLGYDPSVFEEVAPEGVGWPYETPEGLAALEDWRTCLRAQGLTPVEHESPVPAEAWDAGLDEQVRIGRIDLACKEQTDFVQRLADVEAALQTEYIGRAQEYLEQLRPVQQAASETARAYLQDAGVPVPGEQ